MKQEVKKQGRVIGRFKRNIPVGEFDKWKDQIRRKARGYGLYALYDVNKLIYVGLAAKGAIKARIQAAIRTKKFTHFSVFLVTGTRGEAQERRIRDLEALLLNIIKPRPRLNIIKTKFVAAQKLELSTVSSQ